MRVLRIYIDTSVIGGCFDPEFSLWSNRLIQDFCDGRFLPVVSSVVATEIEFAPEQVRAKFAEILQLGYVFLELTEEVVSLAEVKHIVWLEKIRIFNAVNLELGYKPLLIHSPQEVASYE